MRRDISALAEKEYDLVIIGGGAFGVCAAWDAALRGLSVALVERGDFCHATSANHFKMVHGGLRYLQHGDINRIRESSRERSILLRIAPHLVQPLPIVIPTYGYGLQGKEILKAGFGLYDLITVDRNRGLRDPQRCIPRGRFISRNECLELFPDLEKRNLTGAALFYDGQMYNPPRLVLAYLRSAVGAGAQAANYVEVTSFLRKSDRVVGVKVKDVLTGNPFDIRSKMVLNASGPWAERLLGRELKLQLTPPSAFSRDACFISTQRLPGKYGIAVKGRTKDPDAIISRNKRHLFIVPWHDYTLIGVWHSVYEGEPDACHVTEKELQAFLDEINAAYPVLSLRLEHISRWNAGLVLFGDNKSGSTNLSYGKRSRLVDHARDHGMQGLITLIGVRATTSRGMAEKAIDLVCRKLQRRVPKSTTAVTSIYGGKIGQFEPFLEHATAQRPAGLRAELMRPLIHNYGSTYQEILKYVNEEPAWADIFEASTVLKAEVVHAVHEEMAQKLGDVVFRRTDLGTGRYPGAKALQTCAELMAKELRKDENWVQRELEEICAAFPSWSRTANVTDR